jgi:hypothetical protein
VTHRRASTYPQKLAGEGDDYRFLTDAFRSWGDPAALIVERIGVRFMGQDVTSFATRPLPPSRPKSSKGGRPVIYPDATQRYEGLRFGFERRGWHLSDGEAADLLRVSVRTIEDWRRRGLIGGGRKRRP